MEHINRMMIITILVALNVTCDNNEPFEPNNAATDSPINLEGDNFCLLVLANIYPKIKLNNNNAKKYGKKYIPKNLNMELIIKCLSL